MNFKCNSIWDTVAGLHKGGGDACSFAVWTQRLKRKKNKNKISEKTGGKSHLLDTNQWSYEVWLLTVTVRTAYPRTCNVHLLEAAGIHSNVHCSHILPFLQTATNSARTSARCSWQSYSSLSPQTTHVHLLSSISSSRNSSSEVSSVVFLKCKSWGEGKKISCIVNSYSNYII